MSTLRRWLNNLPIQDPIERESAALLQVVLIGLLVVIILATLASLTLAPLSALEKLSGMRGNLFGFLVIALPLGLLRRGYFRASALIVIMILFITPTLAITAAFDLLTSGGILVQFTLAIILAGLLVSRRAMALAYGLSAAVVGFAALRGQNPALQFAVAANFILFNGLIALFLDQFGIALRTALTDALERGGELQSEIAERKQAQEALQLAHYSLEQQVEERTAALSQANNLLQTLLDHTPDHIFFKDIQSRFIRNSRSQAKMLGVNDPADVIGKSDFDFFPHAQRAYDEEQEIIRTGMPLVDFEEHVIWPDGRETWVSTTKTPLRGQDEQIIGTFGIARDITDRKRAEEALRKAKEELEIKVTERTTELSRANEKLQLQLIELKQAEATSAQLAAIVDSSEDAIIGKTLAGVITSWNSGAEHLYGYSAEEAIGQSISILIPSDLPNELPEILSRLRQGESIKHFETTRVRKDGRRLIVSLTVSPIRDASGQIHGASTIARDVTERKRAEEAVKESQELFTKVFELSPAGMIAARLSDGVIINSNQRYAELLGYTRSELIGKRGLDLGITTVETREKLLAELERAGHIHDVEVSLVKKSGQTLEALLSIEVIELQGEKHNMTIMHDITERKHAEAKIERQNRRLSVLREIDLAILAADSAEDIVDGALRHIRELTGCRRSSLSLIDWAANETVLFNVSANGETFMPAGTRVPLAPIQAMLQTFTKNQPVILNDLTALADPLPQIQNAIREGFRSLCFLPLFSQSELIGTFSMSSEFPGFFDEDIISLGHEVANQAAIAISQSRLRDELSNSRARMDGIIQSAMDAVISIGADQRILLFNAAAEHMFRCPAAEALNQPLERFIPERFRAVHHTHIEQFGLAGVTNRTMGHLSALSGLRADGEEFPIEASISQVEVAGEKIFTVILRDITIRKQAEAALQESEQKYSVLFDQAAIPAALTRLPENTFIQVNAAFENVLGYSQQEVFGKTSMELGMVRPDEQARTIAEVEKYGTALNNEKHIFTKSGEVRVVLINVSRVGIGGQNYAITTLQDITERKRAEIELQQAVEELKRSNAELEQFAYVASHDLQEPLRMVSSYLQLLSRRYQGKLDSNADEFIGYAVDGARRMQGLIEDLLAYSRVGTRGKPFEMVSADQALDRALTQLGVAIHESSADITRTELPTLMADSAQLVQLFQNLIGNAIKFHKPGELPQIEIAAVQEGTAWKFSVRDHGIGLEPQFAERIFVIFQRLNTRTEYPGTGIGLAICKKIVERHGGRIWVESQLGGGAAFYFTFSTSIKGAAP